LNIDNKISSLWRYAEVVRSKVTFVDAIKMTSTLNNNKIILSADDCVLINMLKQEKK